MTNNENYEKDSRQKFVALLDDCGWQKRGAGFWEKGNLCLLVDEVGIFLFRWLRKRWVRTHGRAHASMWRAIHTKMIIFSDGAKLNIEHATFTPAPRRQDR